MTKTTLRILYVAAEAAPFVKVGGLGDVTGSLPVALRSLSKKARHGIDLDLRLVLPFHPVIPRSAASSQPVVEFLVPKPSGAVEARAYLADLEGILVYLIAGAPVPTEGGVYSLDTQKDGEKFTFFSLAALELCHTLGWQPDILHAHDWHAALSLHELAARRMQSSFFTNTRSILTIHNLPYMGGGTDQALRAYGILPSLEMRLPEWGRYQPLPMGMAAADSITTVSPTYSREIMTAEFGCGLEPYLQSRAETVTGILNGLDIAAWDPASDITLASPFNIDSIQARTANKTALLEEVGLVPQPGTPLLILISRFDRQKGIDLVAGALRQLQDEPWQAVLLGSGDSGLEQAAQQAERDLPERVRTVMRYDQDLSHRMYAGGDLLLMPSRYEPCGLAQMIAMRYGCLPVANATGGLRDTIFDLDDPARSTGFLFENATSDALSAALRRGLAAYADQTAWQARQHFAMQQDFSWTRSAQAYFNLYLDLTQSRFA
jgi:starch synthase